MGRSVLWEFLRVGVSRAGPFIYGTFLEWDVSRAGPFVCTPFFQTITPKENYSLSLKFSVLNTLPAPKV